MKLVNARLGIRLDFPENQPFLLVVENAALMARCTEELYQQCSGGEGDFILSEEKELKMEKACQVVLDPFGLDLNSKRIVTLLYKKLAQSTDGLLEAKANLMGECVNLLEAKANLMGECVNLLEANLTGSGLTNVSYKLDLEWQDLYKMLNVHIDEQSENLLDKLVTYVKVIAELGNVHLLVFVGLCAFLTADERKELIQMAAYLHIQLLFLEGREPRSYLSGEVRYIIDKDLCLIQC